MTGIYFRVRRDDKWVNLEIEHMTDEERDSGLATFDRFALLRTIHMLCANLSSVGANKPGELQNGQDPDRI